MTDQLIWWGKAHSLVAKPSDLPVTKTAYSDESTAYVGPEALEASPCWCLALRHRD
jgi:hypothetical protein